MDFSYSVNNLRRLTNMPLIEIRPITILVGRNSAGKSTLLRTFPLIKQSLMTRASAPILWYGDYVDFGDFQTSISNGDSKSDVVFSFEFEELDYEVRPTRRVYSQDRVKFKSQKVCASYHVSYVNKKTVLRKIDLTIAEENTTFEIVLHGSPHEKVGVRVNGFDVFHKSKVSGPHSLDKDLFKPPEFLLEKRLDDRVRKIRREPMVEIEGLVFDILREKIAKTVVNRTISREVRKILRCHELASSLRDWSGSAETLAFRKFYSNLSDVCAEDSSNEIIGLRGAYKAFAALSYLDIELSNFFSEIRYLGPARARSERYYRKQELEVSEISPDGQNLPMFLASLKPSKLMEFSHWVEAIYGYGVQLRSTPGHSSIFLTLDEKEVNVADTGYGVSQLLPVLAQIWWAGVKVDRQFRRASGRIRTLAIEQPELHLHPAHQALLADVFAKAVTSDTNFSTRLLVETHSEALINRLGELIEKDVIRADQVQVIVFDASNEINAPTKVTVAKFGDNGELTNWPFGFFNY